MGCGASQSAQVVQMAPNVQVDNRKPYKEVTWASKSVQTDEIIEAMKAVNLGAVGGAPDTDEGHHGGAHGSGAQAKDINNPEEVWLQVCETLDVPEGKTNPNTDLVVKRSGWKTIRIFVSSTFKDFQEEREILVKEVFPDLRVWCEARRLHLVECDLRWGIPKDATTELTLRTCLGEIDRCYMDNVMPFFLNMTSERIGWIPLPEEVPHNLVDEYRCIFGLSITEMEIVHGAYRKANPNSLFLMRDDSFLQSVPAKYQSIFVDDKSIAPAKLKVLRKMIENRFPEERVVNYTCRYTGTDDQTGKIKFEIDPDFKQKTYNFFRERIEKQYPLIDAETDPYVRTTELHESFMKNKADSVVGIAKIVGKISEYIDDTGGQDVPLLLLGDQGLGKTSIMAKCTDTTITRALDGKLPRGKKWHVFYHFVGAVAGSTDLEKMLKRLLKQLNVINDNSMPPDLEATVQFACGALNNPSIKPVIIFVDAANQFDTNTHSTLMTWLPRKLAPHVRVIMSMIPGTPPHENLRKRENKPCEIQVPPLSLAIRKEIVSEMLGKFNKRLDMDQMIALLTKRTSDNPLWLSIACEELRLFGSFRQIEDKINNLADGLLEILEQVLSRFEEENGGHLLVATLCLLESSRFGLLESELLQILADEDSLMPPTEKLEKGSKEKYEKEMFKKDQQLSAYKWAMVYRALRPFLRPYGDSGEGRLDFYHRSLSKAVRKKYLKMPHTDEHNAASKELSQWWHRKLAKFFSISDHLDRQIEEYPYHLLEIGDKTSLEKFLARWDVVDKLYNREYSTDLIKYWQECGGFQHMADIYSEQLRDLKDEKGTTTEVLADRCNQVARILIQAGIYDPALELANNALNLETSELGSRPEKLAELHSSISFVWDQKVKLHEFVSRDQLPEEKECLDHGQKAIDLYRQLQSKDDYFKSQLCMQLVKQAFSFASWADCGGNEDLSASEALKKGDENIQEAIELATELKENGKLAEAHMTKAVLMRYNPEKQLKSYNQALELCQQTYGEYHMLTARIYFNTAIVFEDRRNYDKAYDYFRKNYEIVVQVFGHDHIKSQRAKGVLSESTYSSIAARRGHSYVV